MPIFIARDYDGTPIDVVLARNFELANAYWHGKGIFPHTHEEKNDSQLENHPTGVLPIVTTKDVHLHRLRDRGGLETIKVITK